MHRAPTYAVFRDRRLAAFAACASLLAPCGNALAQSLPDADRQADALISQMTLEEKLQLVHGGGRSPIGGAAVVPGIPRLGIPAVNYADASSGVHVKGSRSTPLPGNLALAATWDIGLAHDYGALIGKELRSLGFNASLGGGINLAREPRGGRTFEYMGEDPLLAGSLLAARIRGTQEQHVMAMAKHYALNGQETNRFTSNSIVDEGTMRELYLRGFEIAIKESAPAIVMCAYNRVNGEKACQNRHLIHDILKGDFHFKGFVQSDWMLAVEDGAVAANAGLDEEEPGSADDFKKGTLGEYSQFNQRLKAHVMAGTVTRARLDDMVHRKLAAMIRVGLMQPALPPVRMDEPAGDALARRIAEEAIVLLKNAGKRGGAPVLPLAGRGSIVVIGGHADAGVLSGGGAASVEDRDGNAVACLTPGAKDPFTHIVDLCANWHRSSPYAALKQAAPGMDITFVDGGDAKAAAAAAAKADVAIVFATQFLTEQVDLAGLALPDNRLDPANQSYDQNALIEAVAAASPATVVVLENGTAVTMPWLGRVDAVLAAWYPGIKGGQALADILLGRVNPSGKLPLSFPANEKDLPQASIAPTDLAVHYKEGLAMGYRRHDALHIAPLFPFGHGLSYSKFSYDGLRVAPGARGGVTARFYLTNLSDRSGSEVAQLYATLPRTANEPPQRLVGWQRVALRPHERREIVIDVAAARLAIWTKGWEVRAGSTSLRAGGSAGRDEGVSVRFRLHRRKLASGA